jgi:iron(III) transport system substrate-binding protein
MEVMSMIALGHKLYNISEFMEEIMKKRFFAGLLAAMMALSATGCSGSTEETAAAASEAEETAAAQAEESSEAESSEAAEAPELSGTMKVVATSEDYVTLFDKFTEETGVKVELLSMSSGEVLSKLRAEGGTPSADLWFGGGIDAFMSAKDDGLLEQVNFDAAADLSPEYKDEEGYWYSKGITIVGFLVNEALTADLGIETPASWTDLLDESYQGEIVMSNPAVSGTNYAVVNALLQTMGEEEGWNYFEKLNNNIAYYGKRGSDPLNKVTSDEFAIGISYIDRGVEATIEGSDIAIVYPEDGIPWVPEGVAVFKNAENVDAAKYFVEWLFSSDDNLRMLAEIDKKDGIKLIKPSIEGIELGYDTAILMKEDLSLFGSEREAVLEKFEALMGDKAEA